MSPEERYSTAHLEEQLKVADAKQSDEVTKLEDAARLVFNYAAQKVEQERVEIIREIEQLMQHGVSDEFRKRFHLLFKLPRV